MKISHECPTGLLELSLSFNDYDYFLIHQILKYPEYEEFFKRSKELNRVQILDNSLYELGKSFDASQFADAVKRLKPTEYLIPDCFNDFKGNIRMFDSWMEKYGDVPGIKIATIHGKTPEEFQRAYDYFCGFNNIKIAFNFAEEIYSKVDRNPVVGRFKVISGLKIDPTRRHHLLGCTSALEFEAYRDFNWIETIDTSNPITAAFEGSEYPVAKKPKLAVDDLQDVPLTNEIKERVLKNTRKFKNIIISGNGF